MKKGIIDRFEGDYAILEMKDALKPVKRSEIPPQAREGDVLVFTGHQWQVDHEATAKLNEEIQKLIDEVWE